MGDGPHEPCDLPDAHKDNYSRRLYLGPGPAFAIIILTVFWETAIQNVRGCPEVFNKFIRETT